MADYPRKLPTTGYWIFVCNTSQWNADEWLALNEQQIHYRISGHHEHDVRPGQLGVLRLNDDRRTEAQRGDRSRHKAGIYAVFRVVGFPEFGTDPDPRFYNGDKQSDPRWRTPVRIIANLLNSPVLIEELPDTAEFQYVRRPLQTSTIPIAESAFVEIIDRAGLDPLSLEESTQVPATDNQEPEHSSKIEDDMRVYIANFGRENFEWPVCRQENTIAVMNEPAEQHFWEASDKEGYIRYCLEHSKTATGLAPTRSVASRWYGAMSSVSETANDVWFHREKQQLWWTISSENPPDIRTETAPYLPENRNTIFVCHKKCAPWSNANLKGRRLDWNSLHPKAKEFLFTEGTLQQLSPDNSQYARALIRGDDLSPWHSRAEWNKRADTAKRGSATIYNAKEKAIWRMVDTAISTAAQANGQQVQRTLKNKDIRFSSKEAFTAYVKKLLESQEGLCAITGIALQYDGETGDVELQCSLDRKDSEGHYEEGNLQIVCRFVNRWKSSSVDSSFRRLIDLVRTTG